MWIWGGGWYFWKSSNRQEQGRNKSSIKSTFLPLIQNYRQQYSLDGFPIGSDSILESSFRERFKKGRYKRVPITKKKQSVLKIIRGASRKSSPNKTRDQKSKHNFITHKTMKTSKNPKSVTGKKLTKSEAKAIVGGRTVKGNVSKSKLQSSTGIS